MSRAVSRLRSDVVVVTAILLAGVVLVATAHWLGAVLDGRSFGEPRPTTEIVSVEIAVEILDSAGHGSRLDDRARLVAIAELTSTHPAFGGFSSLEHVPLADDGGGRLDGARFLALTDQGRWLSFRARTDGDDRLVALEEARLGALRDLDGRPVVGRFRRDAEETTRWSDGFLVAFEGEHRLVAHAGPEPFEDPSPRLLTPPAEAADLEVNDGFEAMTALGDGRVLLVGEGSRPDAAEHPERPAPRSLRAWIGDPETGRWSSLRIAATGPFQATAATLLPWGDVLLLERFYDPATDRVVARLSALSSAALEPGARVETHELIVFTDDGPVDNFESLAAVPVPGGAIALLLADDNFADDQRTLLAQVFVAEPQARHGAHREGHHAARPSSAGGR